MVNPALLIPGEDQSSRRLFEIEDVPGGNLIVWPLAYVILSKWLFTFVFRISLLLLVFVSTAATALLIAFQILMAAVSNPVHSLRYE